MPESLQQVGQNRGYAFVRFRDAANALAALEGTHDSPLTGFEARSNKHLSVHLIDKRRDDLGSSVGGSSGSGMFSLHGMASHSFHPSEDVSLPTPEEQDVAFGPPSLGGSSGWKKAQQSSRSRPLESGGSGAPVSLGGSAGGTVLRPRPVAGAPALERW